MASLQELVQQALEQNSGNNGQTVQTVDGSSMSTKSASGNC